MMPFLHLPRFIMNANGDGVNVEGRVRPDSIADYYAGAVDPSVTVVVLHGNCSFLVNMPVTAFDNLLKDYYKYVERYKSSLPVIIKYDDLKNI